MTTSGYDLPLHGADWDARLLAATRRGEIHWSAAGLARWQSLRDVACQMSRQFRDNAQWQHNREHACNMVEAIQYCRSSNEAENAHA